MIDGCNECPADVDGASVAAGERVDETSQHLQLKLSARDAVSVDG